MDSKSPKGLKARVATLASGALVGQAAVALSGPAISRIYEPATVGYYSAWFALLSIIVAFASLRWEYALPSAAEQDRQALFALALLTASIVAVAVLIMTLPRRSELGGLLIWLAPAILLQAVYQCGVQWSLINGRIKAAGRSKSAHGLAQATAQMGFGLAVAEPTSLAVGYAVSSSVGTLPVLRQLPGVLSIKPARLWRTAKQYWRTSFWVLLSSVMNTAGTQAPVLIIGAISAVSAGQFALGIRSATAPMVLLGIAITQVFLSQIATGKSDTIGRDLTTVVRTLFPLLFAAVGSVAAMGDQLASILLGAEWTEAGVMLQILSPAILLIALSTTMSMIPISLGHARGEAAYQAVLLTLRLTCMLIGGLMAGVMGIVIGYTVATVGCLSLYIRWCYKLSSASLRTTFFTYTSRDHVALGSVVIACTASFILFRVTALGAVWSVAAVLICLSPLAMMRLRK